MESFPKFISGLAQRDETALDFQADQNTYVNCNICRNFSNILNPGHRKSKDHQKKMSEKLRVIRAKVKTVGLYSVSVHDEEWQKKDYWFCYFCEKSVEKHKVDDRLMVETLGYMTHLANPEHAKAVKSYLKYHGRKEKFEIFCKTEEQLNKFVEKIPDAKEKYLKKLEILNMKDVQAIRDVDDQRKKLVEESAQMSTVTSYETGTVSQSQQSHSLNKVPFITQTYSNTSVEQMKTPPWQTEESNSMKQPSNEPAIGPTMETLVKHVANRKKKGLPVKRLGANLRRTKESSARWLPSFRGVWNKGKRKLPKSRLSQKF